MTALPPYRAWLNVFTVTVCALCSFQTTELVSMAGDPGSSRPENTPLQQLRHMSFATADRAGTSFASLSCAITTQTQTVSTTAKPSGSRAGGQHMETRPAAGHMNSGTADVGTPKSNVTTQTCLVA